MWTRALVIAEKKLRDAQRRRGSSRELAFPVATDFSRRGTRWFIINERRADFRRKPLIIEPLQIAAKPRACSTGPDRDCRDLVSNCKL